MTANKVEEVAKIFGKKLKETFKVIGANNEVKEVATIRFSYDHGIERFDGTNWNRADYFLPVMITGKVRVYEKNEQLKLFEEGG